jgi:hypothetical protein
MDCEIVGCCPDKIRRKPLCAANLQRMFTLKGTQGYWDKDFRLSKFAALGEFSLRAYRGREMGKRFGDA